MFQFPSITLIGLLQIICLIHAVKTGRANPWLYILLFLPGISLLLYLILEILPELSANSLWQNLTHRNPSLSELKKAAEEIPTITNLENLADALVLDRQLNQAIAVYQQALTHEPNAYPDLHRKLAGCYFKTKHFQAAKTELEILSHSDDYHPKDQILFARTLASLGESDQAARLFAAAVPKSLDLSASYYYARLLRQRGDKAQLTALLKSANTTYQELAPRYQRQEKSWWHKLNSQFK